MYSYISGSLEYVGKDFIVVDNSGIGYKIQTAVSSINGVKLTDKVKIYTYLHVREDIMSLYGFLTIGELEMFELLISVSGVGPKAGISLLSCLNPSKFALAIIGNDIKSFTQASGIGPKVAQRIILELKDKVSTNDIMDEDSILCDINDDECEAVNALVVLGYTKNEAAKAVNSLDDKSDIENMIKGALKKLVRF